MIRFLDIIICFVIKPRDPSSLIEKAEPRISRRVSKKREKKVVTSRMEENIIYYYKWEASKMKS
ncbi:hypothetical protein H5410_019341 [Solanum commersonii]|uniref:Uncharacterized protein n=1 Tax=Solanum commersonii TaxID=4109 RepID=A0A9J5Z9C2_SOLCO|nr:hypothetical protein H5410_019341 [Solanum commersonii]